MPAHKVLIFIGMLIFEICAWGFVGNRLAPIFSSENTQYEITGDCNCEHEIPYRIKHANISDAKKTEYLTKFATMNPFEKEFFEKDIKNTSIGITYTERLTILSRRIALIGLIFSFLFTMIFTIILNQSNGHGFLSPPLCWIVVGFIMLVYYYTSGKKERDAKKRESLHKKVSGLTERFKQFKRMA